MNTSHITKGNTMHTIFAYDVDIQKWLGVGDSEYRVIRNNGGYCVGPNGSHVVIGQKERPYYGFPPVSVQISGYAHDHKDEWRDLLSLADKPFTRIHPALPAMPCNAIDHVFGMIGEKGRPLGEQSRHGHHEHWRGMYPECRMEQERQGA